MSACIDDTLLERYQAGTLEPAASTAVRDHLRQCVSCAERYARRLHDDHPPHPPVTRSLAGGSPGIVVAGFEVIRQLGAGGQGHIYLARRHTTGTLVAIKVLGPDANPQRFQREVDVLAGLNHPHIVAVQDAGTSNGQPFYVMDYIRGVPITDHVRAARLDLRATLQLFMTLCDALQYAHHNGVIHRDIHPANILVDDHGVARILDFGLAKCFAPGPGKQQTHPGAFLGVPAYASPEAASGHPLDMRADIYGLGVTLYESLTGELPYAVHGQDYDHILATVRSTPARPPRQMWDAERGVPSRDRDARRSRCPIDHTLQCVILKALEKAPANRYQSAFDLSTDLQRYLDGEPLEIAHGPVGYALHRAWRQYRTRTRRIAAAVLMALGALYLLGQIQRAWHGTQLHTLIGRGIETNAEGDRGATEDLMLQARAVAPSADVRSRIDDTLALIEGTQLPRRDKIRRLLERSRQHRADTSDALYFDALIEQLLGLPELAQDSIERAHRAALRDPRAAREGLPILSVHDASDPLVGRPSAAPPTAEEPPDRTAVIDRTLRRWPRTFNPVLADSDNEDAVLELMFDALYHLDATLQPVWNPAMLAEAPSQDHGGTTLRLRPDLSWHDDRALTAADVVYSWENLPDTTYADVKDALDAIEALDPHTLRVRHPADIDPAWFLVFPVVPEGTCFDAADPACREPPGNGPYRIDPALFGAGQLVLQRYEPYLQRLPLGDDGGPAGAYFKTVRFHVLPEQTQRAAALAEGRIAECPLGATGFWWHVSGSDFNGRVTKVIQPGRVEEFILWNLTDHGGPLADVGVRRALARGLDRRGVINRWFAGLYEPWHMMFPQWPWVEQARPVPLDVLPYDLQAAAGALDESGWVLSHDGIRRRDGVALELSVMVSEAAQESQVVVQHFALDLQQIGVRMHVDVVPDGTYLSRRSAGDFDAVFAGLINTRQPDHLRRRWHSARSRHPYGYANPDLDRLLDALLTTPLDEHPAMLADIERIIYADQPVAFLWHKPTLWAFDSNLRGVAVARCGPTGFSPGPRAWWKPFSTDDGD